MVDKVGAMVASIRFGIFCLFVLFSQKLKNNVYHHSHHHHWLDILVWALTLLRVDRHFSQFDATFFQFSIPEILMCCHTHYSHLNLGLPTFLLPSGLMHLLNHFIFSSAC